MNVYGYELEMAYYQKFNQLELTKGQLEQALGEATGEGLRSSSPTIQCTGKHMRTGGQI